jgi:hypothetical protein
MDKPLAEKKLVVELAVAVSQFMQSGPPDNTDEDGFVWHMFQGPFDENCYVLWELGAAWAASPLGGQGMTFQQWHDAEPEAVGPGAFKFMPPEETRAIVMAHREIPPPLIFRLLDAYLRSMGDHTWRGAQLDVSREAFVPEPIFEPQIQVLIECGYLVRSESLVKWTDQIGPVMQSAGHWDATADGPSPTVITLPYEAQARIECLIRSGQRIEAIAAVRAVANVELTDAMRFIAEIDRSMACK